MRVYFCYDRRHKATSEKKGAVELRVYFGKHSEKVIRTGIELFPVQWDDMVVNCPDSGKLNRQLRDFKKRHEDILSLMRVDGVEINLDNFNLYLGTKKEDLPDNFIDFMYEEICKNKIRETTREQHFIAYNALVRFGKIKSFASLTPHLLQEFDDFLRKDNPKRSQITIHGYHKRIKPYVIKAYKLGYIESNPYLRFTDVRGSSKERQPLTQDELDKLQSLTFTDKLDKTRDLFVFSCYTGLAYADLESFNYEKEVVESNGMKFIDGHRFKTGTEFYTPILPPAMKVLEKYHLRLPQLSNQKYNDYLHVIEARLGLNKPLTSHVARHTFATTVALAHDVPIETVSKMLGHKDIKTTQIYAKVLKSTIERNVMTKML
jgi:integrase/recombinase XerD